MDDLISRQAAIDALDVLCQEHRYKIPGKSETYSEYNEAWQDALDRAEGLIFNLPSAQPTNIQDILEYLDTVLHPIVSPEHWDIYSELYDMISVLPSAQPENIARDIATIIENEKDMRVVLKNAQPQQLKAPCDVCRYNPPSSADGKPCTMCPAEPYKEEQK